MIRGWRLVAAEFQADAFSGEGARRFGGRWNSPGVAAVYASSTLALAVLELLVRRASWRNTPALFGFQFEIDESDVAELSSNRLPRDWRTNPPSLSTQRLGDRWLKDRKMLVCRIPSAVVPQEENLLINPAHAAFGAIRRHRPVRVTLDPRLVADG